jgi:hypothetical protein
LWGEAEKVGDELFWCQGGGKLPMKVNGSTDEPFFLVSLADPKPNLQAVQLNTTERTSVVHCIYDAHIKEKCDSGNRSTQATLFEQLLNIYNFKAEDFFNNDA